MEMDGLPEVYKLQRFLPTPQEAVGYFLPGLLASETMQGAEKLIHRTNVYACEPKDLAANYPPVPTAVSNGDRFFFTPCKRKNGRCTQRGAGAGTWTVQKTDDVYDAGVKIGEVRNLSFKKGKEKASTGWVMEEYRCLLPQAVVADGEMVLCRIHLAHSPPAAARQESNAYRLRRQEGAGAEPVTVTAQKRPAPAADLPCSKKMRIVAPVPVLEPEVEYEDCATFSTPVAPVSSPAASTEMPEADDDDLGWLSCTIEELLGEVQQEALPVEAAENNIEHHLVVDQEMMEQPAAPIDWESLHLQPLLADDWESEVRREEEETVAENNIQQLVSDQDIDEDIDIDQLVASVDWGFLVADLHKEEAKLEKKRRCNHNAAAADLHAPSFAPVN